MKWKVTTQTGMIFTVSVPDTLKGTLPAIGEPFFLSLQQENPSQKQESVKCQLVADGKSIMLGTQILRLANRPVPLKKSKFRLRASSSAIACDHILEVKHIRPVEPILTAAALGGGPIRAPMTGKILKVHVENGQAVAEGTVLVVIEAMKMENQIRAECSGIVEGIRVRDGESITVESTLLTLNPSREGQA